MNKLLTLCALAALLLTTGCRVVEVENNGEEIARDQDGKPVLLQDDTYISEADLAALEALAKRVQDRSEYGGGLILSLVNMYRHIKRQKPTE